ncbi:hypothetical protein TorRG33x02_315920, partial [Trema orientale]
EHNNFSKEFGRWWNETTTTGWEGYKFLNKLRLVKDKLKKWNMKVFGDMRMVKQSLLTRIGELDTVEGSRRWNDQLKQERVSIKNRLEEVLFKEERSLQMNSKFT